MRSSAGKHARPAKVKRYGKRIALLILTLIFLGGLGYALYPVGTGTKLVLESHRAVEKFLRYSAANGKSNANIISSGEEVNEVNIDAPMPYSKLYEAMKAYNEQIYAEGQSGLCDAWAYQEPSFDLTEYGMETGVTGVLKIAKINLEMPVYLGATYENMAKGAAHLSQTSLPIGGMNTNCVIAGHRGWQGAPFFLFLDKLEEGDEVSFTNLWETLTYIVCDIRVIKPNDVDEILIQPGRDMLTLVTCHPYASGGKFRLVVFCERVGIAS